MIEKFINNAMTCKTIYNKTLMFFLK